MHTQHDEIIATLETVARAWNAAGIRYGVAHGLEDYPAATGRDLDIQVDRRDINPAIRLAVEALEDQSYSVTVPPDPWQAEALFAFKAENAIEIDLIPRLFWGGAVLAEGVSDTLVDLGPFKVDLWASFAKRILLQILGGFEPKAPWNDPREIESARERCYKLFGKSLAHTLFQNLEEGDVKNLKRLTPRLRRSLIQRAIILKPLQFVRMIPRWASGKTMPFLTRRVPIVALVGPDGAGKSTIVDHLPAQLPSVLLGIESRHWRPNLLPRLAALLRKPSGITINDDGPNLPRQTPGRFSILRLGYYWLDFFIGHFVKDRWASSALRVVVYDRCALDMAIDPLRYGLSSTRGTRLLWRLVPKPDLVILIHDDPARIHARKPELSVAEIARQNTLWLQLAGSGEVTAIIRLDAGPEEIAARVKALIIEKFVECTTQPPSGQQADIKWLRNILQGQE